MSDEPRLRPARVGDAGRIAELSGALGYPADAEALGARLKRLLARDGELVLVAEDDARRILGWAHAAERASVEAPARCELLGLVVDAGARRRGIARRLVAAVERWAADRGLERVVVRSNVARPESHPFYEGIGYTCTKTQHTYEKRTS